MNSTIKPRHPARRHPGASHRQGLPLDSHALPFLDTIPMDSRARSPGNGMPPKVPTITGLLSTYLVCYLVIFIVTLGVLLLTTDLTLALDVVQLVARESLWLTPIAGTALVITRWRTASQRHLRD